MSTSSSYLSGSRYQQTDTSMSVDSQCLYQHYNVARWPKCCMIKHESSYSFRDLAHLPQNNDLRAVGFAIFIVKFRS